MLTTCPECRTVFRVGQAQLDDKRGLVRCGHCQAVFNAYDTLLPELAAPPAGESESLSGLPAPALERVEDELPGLPPELALDLAPAPGEPGPPAPDGVGVGLESGAASPEAPSESDEPVEATDGASPPKPLPEHSPEEAPPPLPEPFPPAGDILLTPIAPPARAGRGVLAALAWGLVSLLLILALLAQVAYFLRAELVAAVPALRAPFEAACASLGCALPLARDPTALRIEASSLESDPEDKARATLRLSLSNRSPRPVAWPHLTLVLTDARDLPIAQRPFAPVEYLPTAVAHRPGLEPDQEQEARLELELKGLSAYGYKLELAYP